MFIHRDFKLSNLLVDENYNVKVCDFGLTKMKQANDSLHDTKGSPLYMAPGTHTLLSDSAMALQLEPALLIVFLVACVASRGVHGVVQREVRCVQLRAELLGDHQRAARVPSVRKQLGGPHQVAMRELRDASHR
jgi:serine/threonine protein kinase